MLIELATLTALGITNLIGPTHHVQGIDVEGEFVWVSAVEKATHKGFLSRFNAKTGLIWGGNWDSRHFYRWRPDGTLIDKRPNPTGTGFQDLKLHDGSLIGNGVKTPTSGTIEWLHPESLTVQRSISTGRTDRNVRYSNEGMAIDNGILYLLPEDDPSRLFRFRLP